MKFLRYIHKRRREMLAVMALTFFSTPFAAQASNIVTKDGTILTPNNNVFNIEIQKKLSDAVGVNKFTNFDLDSGQIANMQFGTLNLLANLVDNKININGTVNAFRNGKIGGNLYFFSPEGIAVGASGVINAGSFTGVAADKAYFEELGKMADAAKFTAAIKPENIIYNNDPEKGIDIQGVINAPGGISIYATKIDIGATANLNTEVSAVNFSKVVNVGAVESGITGGLDAEYKNGDIILKAHAEHIADDSKLKEVTDETTENFDKITERAATINVAGNLKSAKDISINAESVTVFKEGEKFNALIQTPLINKVSTKFSLDASVNFAKKDNTATVNIEKTADIFSKGDTEISSAATLNAEIKTVTPAKGKGNAYVPATAVGVISATNEAIVNVEGKLKSEGQMAINANAKTTLTLDAKTQTSIPKNSNAQEDKFFVAVSVIDGDSKAEVNIKSGDEIKVGGENSDKNSAFTANANVENKISNTAVAASKDKSTINTAVGVTSYTSDAAVNVDRAITAEKGSVKIDATNNAANKNYTSNSFNGEIEPLVNTVILDKNDADKKKADKAKKVETESEAVFTSV